MDTKYTLLNHYRLRKHMTMTAFSKEIGLCIDVVRRTLFGISEPHDYHKIVFDEFYRKHEDEILSTILDTEPITK